MGKVLRWHCRGRCSSAPRGKHRRPVMEACAMFCTGAGRAARSLPRAAQPARTQGPWPEPGAAAQEPSWASDEHFSRMRAAVTPPASPPCAGRSSKWYRIEHASPAPAPVRQILSWRCPLGDGAPGWPAVAHVSYAGVCAAGFVAPSSLPDDCLGRAIADPGRFFPGLVGLRLAALSSCLPSGSSGVAFCC